MITFPDVKGKEKGVTLRLRASLRRMWRQTHAQLPALIASFPSGRIQIFIWFTMTSNQAWWDCGDVYGNVLNRSQFCNSTGEFTIFHLSFQSSLPGRLPGILISPWQASVYHRKAAALRIKSDLQMIDEWAQSQSIIYLDCQLTPVTAEKCQWASRSQCSAFFSAGATLKFISKVVQHIRMYKGKSDGGLAAGGHCDLASMCSDALRAHLLRGLTWESRGGGGRPGIYLCLWESEANLQPGREAQALGLRDTASWTPRRAAEKCQLSPPGPRAPAEPRAEELHPQSEAGVKPYRQRWGAPAHVGLPGLRGCRRDERSKPGRSRSWWHWSESGWSYWWGSAGNLLLEVNAQGGRGEW